MGCRVGWQCLVLAPPGLHGELQGEIALASQRICFGFKPPYVSGVADSGLDCAFAFAGLGRFSTYMMSLRLGGPWPPTRLP